MIPGHLKREHGGEGTKTSANDVSDYPREREGINHVFFSNKLNT